MRLNTARFVNQTPNVESQKWQKNVTSKNSSPSKIENSKIQANDEM